MNGSGETDWVKLIGRMQALMSCMDVSDNVRKAWLYWARQFLEFNHKRSLDALGAAELEAFLDAVAQRRQSTPAARRQAFKAVRFLLEEVLGQHPQGLEKLAARLRKEADPLILTPAQVQELLSTLQGRDWLLASLLYGAGLRLLECLRLRIRDIQPDRILVRDTSGRLLRETLLPARVRDPLRAHQEALKLNHIRELSEGYGGAELPIGAQGSPALARSWMWQFLFPGPYMGAPGQAGGPVLRRHLPEPEGRQLIESAARQAGIVGAVSAATLRNSFAAHLIQRGVAVADVEQLLGVRAMRKTPSSPTVANPVPLLSPVDTLAAH